MRSAKRGGRTSVVEVTNVSRQGFWLLLGSKETFVAFKDFPWFRDASIAAITTVERPSANHLYWPELDIDLAVDSLEHPEHYPLVSKAPRVKERKARVYTSSRRRGGRNPENRVRPGTPRT
jgi:hypothetical protein